MKPVLFLNNIICNYFIWKLFKKFKSVRFIQAEKQSKNTTRPTGSQWCHINESHFGKSLWCHYMPSIFSKNCIKVRRRTVMLILHLYSYNFSWSFSVVSQSSTFWSYYEKREKNKKKHCDSCFTLAWIWL